MGRLLGVLYLASPMRRVHHCVVEGALPSRLRLASAWFRYRRLSCVLCVFLYKQITKASWKQEPYQRTGKNPLLDEGILQLSPG